MPGLFSSSQPPPSDWGADPTPPPPGRPGARGPVDEAPQPGGDARGVTRSGAHAFNAELDLCELDDRDRPGPTWTARGRDLSRAALSFRSRRMCYAGRRLLAAVHLIDSEPVPLFGKVRSCEYDGQGMYLVELDLLPVPEQGEVTGWLKGRGR